eukprot:scaffold11721_cov172-Ochromonas_danica.AAC.4
MTTTPSSSSSSSSSSTSTQLLEDILSKAQAGDIDGLVQAGMKVSLADSTAPVSANSLLEAKLKDTEITRAIVKEKGVDEKEAKEIMDLLDHELALASSSSSTSTSEVVYDDLEVDLAAILNDVTQLKRLEDEAQAVMDGIKASAFKTVAAAAGGGGGEVVNVAGTMSATNERVQREDKVVTTTPAPPLATAAIVEAAAVAAGGGGGEVAVAGGGKEEEEDQVKIFSDLLRATIAQVEQETSSTTTTTSSSTTSSTTSPVASTKEIVDAITMGNYSAFDMRSLLGDALSLFAESLQVNITEEVLAQPHVKADLQAILAESALELSQQVHGLAVQQEALLEQLLTSPPPPPPPPTTTTTTTTPEVLAFEKEKQEELDELLA